MFTAQKQGLLYKVMISAFLLLTGLLPPCAAQSYPSHDVTFIVGFVRLGAADIIAHLISSQLSGRVKQRVVVENHVGGGGNLAAKEVADAAADGYTVLVTTEALAKSSAASKNKGFDTSDLRPVAIVAGIPVVLAINPNNAVKDVKEFIAAARIKAFTYGSVGPDTTAQTQAEYFFKRVAKVKYVNVPLPPGGGAAVAAVVDNHVDAVVVGLPLVAEHIRSGELRGLAIASEKRISVIPGVPTYAEMGFPNITSGGWIGFFVPGNTPDAIVAKLNSEINSVVQEPRSQEFMKRGMFEPVMKNVTEVEDYFKSEVESWRTMLRARTPD